MTIALPGVLEASMTPSKEALNLAIGLFTAEELTLARAAEAAQMTQGEFLRELGRRRISMHYGREEFAEDLEVIGSLRKG